MRPPLKRRGVCRRDPAIQQWPGVQVEDERRRRAATLGLSLSVRGAWLGAGRRWAVSRVAPEAEAALRKVLDRIGPGGGPSNNDALRPCRRVPRDAPGGAGHDRAKLRWLLGKATATLGDKRFADLSPKDVYAWRLTRVEHRDERSALRPPRQRQSATRPSNSSMHSRSSGPWTLRGRRRARQQPQCPSVFPELGRVDPAAQWTGSVDSNRRPLPYYTCARN